MTPAAEAGAAAAVYVLYRGPRRAPASGGTTQLTPFYGSRQSRHIVAIVIV